jgi:hypothetical protein
MNIAQVECEQGQLDAGLASFERAEAILRPMAAECRDSARYRRDLAAVADAIGKLRTRSGQQNH